MSRLGVLPTALFATLLGVSSTIVSAAADPTPAPTVSPTGTAAVPSAQDVRDARQAVTATANDVAGIQAALGAANDRLRTSAIAAERAEEAFNGARYRAQQAAQAARRAAQRAAVAGADLDRQRSAYAGTVLASTQLAPELTALAALTAADGIDTLMQRASTISNAQTALDLQYQRFLAASALAQAATTEARSTNRAAQQAKGEAAQARAAARRSADAAAAEAAAIAAQKTVLVRRLARLQDISVATAAARQSALEQQAAAQAAAAAAAAIEQAPAVVETTPDPTPAAPPSSGTDPGTGTGAGSGSGADPAPTPSEPPAPQPDPDPPAPSGGAAAAIAFARAQIGEPYRWGAAGPNAWDCSGLTMKAWAAGGKSLPHYSVAQYEQSTPIRASQLRPGDLVFWGDSASPSSIFHVALYIGNGRILHAPRTGEPVQEASMYYWIAPSFYARP